MTTSAREGVIRCMEGRQMRTILAAAVLAALVSQASAKDNPHGPQWHFMDKSADMKMAIHPWCVPKTPQWATCTHKGTDWKGGWFTMK
jgi:hypothetical protein